MSVRTIILPKDRFGRLVVVSRSSTRKSYFDVVCDCGGRKSVHRSSLLSGMTQSCGCLQRERAKLHNDKQKANALIRKQKQNQLRRVADLPGEEWRSVPECPLYEVSNLGRIKRVYKRSDRLVGTSRGTAALYNGLGSCVYAGRIAVLVLRAFVGPAPIDKPLARHLDDMPSNNALCNLAWGSRSENMQDALRNGRHDYRSGEAYRSKLGVAIRAAKRKV